MKAEIIETEKEVSLEQRVRDWDIELENFVREVGAKSHTFDIKFSVILGLLLPSFINIHVKFEDGRIYGQSEEGFRICFDKLKQFISMEEGNKKEEVKQQTPILIVPSINWKKYPDEKPTEYGKYLTYRSGGFARLGIWYNQSGWTDNENNDITHWTEFKIQ